MTIAYLPTNCPPQLYTAQLHELLLGDISLCRYLRSSEREALAARDRGQNLRAEPLRLERVL